MEQPQTRRTVPVPRPASVTHAPSDVVVVAVDGSEASVRALVWALRHAARRGLRVEALTTWPLQGQVFVREVAGHFCEPRWQAREAQAAAVARALSQVDDAPVCDLRVVNAPLVDALVRASRRAVIVVLGSDGPGEAAPGRPRLTDQVRRTIPDLVVVVGPGGPIDAEARPTGSGRTEGRSGSPA